MVSLVVPAISLTIVLSSPTIAFNRDDLPTLGCPMIAILGSSVFTSSASMEIKLATSSSTSPVPLPDMEEIKNMCSKPRE